MFLDNAEKFTRVMFWSMKVSVVQKYMIFRSKIAP